ncbi:MAG: hypothetical protein AB1546_06695 [bacterium]
MFNFKKLKELEELYERGEVLEPECFSGEYYVVVPWFPWLSLEIMKHRKAVDADCKGDNVILKGTRFGHFQLELKNDHLLINYDQPQNSMVMRRVIDRVRRLPDGRIVGKLYYKILDREIFLMFFEMRKKDG